MSASREKRLRRELREAEANSDTVKKVKKKKKPMTPAKAKKLRGIIGTIVAILVVVVFALLIFVNSGVLQENTTAVTVGSHKLTPVEFNYYYQDTYANIKSSMSSYWSYMVDTTKPIEDQDCMMSEDGGTWKDYITQSAIDSAAQMYTLYDAALEAGYTLPEDAQSSLDSVPESIESYAKSQGFKSADKYLEEYYGKGASAESYMAYLTVQQYASSYATEKSDSFTYTDEELRTYYNDNKQDFDKVTYRVFNVATEDDNAAAAKETADAMQAELDSTEKSFSDAAYKYAPEDSKESYEDADYTLRQNSGYSSISSDYADWLFDEARVAGESQVLATSSGYAVVMFVSRDDNQYNTVNVRHILVQVDATGQDDDGNAISTDADWEDCKAKMDEIQAEWEASDMTEDTFAAMAEEQSEDTGSASNGGLYEDADYTLRQNSGYSSISSDYADWLFDESRVAGESQVIATSSGYAVVMFVSRDDNQYNTVNVRHILVQVDATGQDDDGNAISTDADWEDCKAKMDEIQAEWEASDMTEDTFAAMAEEQSEDTGSASNGGLYEDVYKGQMVTEFEDWCFDESRQVGDWGVVKTDYGYHLMYYSGTGDEYWKSLADSSKRSDDYSAWYEERSASYEGKSKFFGQLFTNKALAA